MSLSPRTDPKRTLNRVLTDPEQIPNGPYYRQAKFEKPLSKMFLGRSVLLEHVFVGRNRGPRPPVPPARKRGWRAALRQCRRRTGRFCTGGSGGPGPTVRLTKSRFKRYKCRPWKKFVISLGFVLLVSLAMTSVRNTYSGWQFQWQWWHTSS